MRQTKIGEYASYPYRCANADMSDMTYLEGFGEHAIMCMAHRHRILESECGREGCRWRRLQD